MSNLVADEIVVSQDPGSFVQNSRTKAQHNVNRQIVSTMAGLRRVKTSSSVKIRSDLLVTGRGILRALNSEARAIKGDKTFSWVKERLIVTNVTSVNPRTGLELPFHPCDWLYCGRTDDLLRLWDIPMFKEPQWTEWFLERPKPLNFPLEDFFSRFQPESYIWSSFVAKNIPLAFEHSSDVSGENLTLSDASFASNLLVLTRRQLSLRWLKPVPLYNLGFMYSYASWRKLVVKTTEQKVARKFDPESIQVGTLVAFGWAVRHIRRMIFRG